MLSKLFASSAGTLSSVDVKSLSCHDRLACVAPIAQSKITIILTVLIISILSLSFFLVERWTSFIILWLTLTISILFLELYKFFFKKDLKAVGIDKLGNWFILFSDNQWYRYYPYYVAHFSCYAFYLKGFVLHPKKGVFKLYGKHVFWIDSYDPLTWSVLLKASKSVSEFRGVTT